MEVAATAEQELNRGIEFRGVARRNGKPRSSCSDLEREKVDSCSRKESFSRL
jgi:hypothetical protein